MSHIIVTASPRRFKDRDRVCAYLVCAIASRCRVLAVDLDIDKRALTEALLALETESMRTLFSILTGNVKFREAIYELSVLNPRLKLPRNITVSLLPARRGSGLYGLVESPSRLFKLVEMSEVVGRLEAFLNSLLLVRDYDYIIVDSTVDLYPFTPRVVLKILKNVVVLMEPNEEDLNKIKDLKTAVSDINIAQVILYKYDSEKHIPKPKAEESWEKLVSRVLNIPENVVVGIPGRNIQDEMLVAAGRLMETFSGVAVKPLEEAKKLRAVEPKIERVGGELLTDPLKLARIVLNSELLEVRRVEASRCVDELRSVVGDGIYYVAVSPKSKEWTLRIIYRDRRIVEASLELKGKTITGDEVLKLVEKLGGEAFADISIVREI
jgi:cellulose biosynthesis protein BcsQ